MGTVRRTREQDLDARYQPPHRCVEYGGIGRPQSAEATIPGGKRWLPKGMEVSYLARSTSDLTCSAETDPDAWTAGPDVPVRVKATRDDGTVVVEGTIFLWVTDRPTT